jgi:hypothetical protein
LLNPVRSEGAGTSVGLIEEGELLTTFYSVFGQIDYDLTEELTFIAGRRVSQA